MWNLFWRNLNNANDVVLVSFLWNLNKFHTLFWCLPRWIWTGMCQLEHWNNYSLQWNSQASKNFNESRQNSIPVNLFYFSLPNTVQNFQNIEWKDFQIDLLPMNKRKDEAINWRFYMTLADNSFARSWKSNFT